MLCASLNSSSVNSPSSPSWTATLITYRSTFDRSCSSRDFRLYFDSSRALAAEWDTANPRTNHDIVQFFRASTSYLYNLAIWEASGNRPHYLAHPLPILASHGTRTVLDYGCGIGSDTFPTPQRIRRHRM
jgi:hypothetical protein